MGIMLRSKGRGESSDDMITLRVLGIRYEDGIIVCTRVTE